MGGVCVFELFIEIFIKISDICILFFVCEKWIGIFKLFRFGSIFDIVVIIIINKGIMMWYVL